MSWKAPEEEPCGPIEQGWPRCRGRVQGGPSWLGSGLELGTAVKKDRDLLALLGIKVGEPSQEQNVMNLALEGCRLHCPGFLLGRFSSTHPCP